MTTLVMNFYKAASGSVDVRAIREKISAPSNDVLFLGFLLIALQVADGILTAVGVSHFGSSAEGNMLIRFLMERWGSVPALVFVKSFAIAVVCTLCALASIVPWLRKAMKLVIGVYVCAAILPWSAIIISHIL